MAGRRVLALVMVGALMAACSSAPSKDIKGTVEEWQLSLSPGTGLAGEVTFTITNNGEKTHEFVVAKTDLAPDKLPVDADGLVDEAQGLDVIGEVEDIAAGASNQKLTLTLTPGKYVIFCNIHADNLVHYQKGMHTAFTVQ